jgi:RNA polymerase sigma factor (sigma-70 family)
MREEIREQAKRIAAKFGKTYEQQQDIEGRCLEAAWLAEPQLDTSHNPKAYLNTTMRNAALDYLKDKTIPTELQLLDTIPESEEVEEKLLENILLKNAIPKLISKLKYPDKEIVQMLLKGDTLEEIGKKLNMRPNSIAVKIHRKRKSWSKLLEK